MELGEVEKIHGNLIKIYDKIEKFDPEYVFTRRGKPLSLDRIQLMLSSQRRNVTLIEYFVTRDSILIFIVSSKDRRLHVESVPLPSATLRRHIGNYWREVVYHLYLDDVGDTWLDLSDYLIESVSEHLTEGDLIYFIPHGPLHYLPMHALQLKGEPLIRRYPVAYSPSASLMGFCQKKGSGRLQSCVSFGVVFEEEATEIAALYNTKPYNGSLAVKETVFKNCVDKDIIHFSCHGDFNNKVPLASGVKLNNGVLSAREIFNMRLNTELVTLSACQTGLNERSPGDELIGLTRAFLYAGAPSVIVSLWSVDAQSKRELMLEFYRLLKSGLARALNLGADQKIQTTIPPSQHEGQPSEGIRCQVWAPMLGV